MATNNDTLVAIHSKPRAGYSSYSVYVGANPFGPRGGRAGVAVDGKCIADRLHFTPAVHVADKYVAAHPGAKLVLTVSQAAGAARARKGA